ncbi:MAG: hypothetical protein HYY24_15360 [Verrucomicrobia bacterium]|nr:hypothetical protein [Verrucomicrobiota bacterium]
MSTREGSFALRGLLPTTLLLGCLAFGPSGEAQPANINISFVQPAAAALVGDDLWAVVTVSSTFEIRSVVARVEDRQASLVFSSTAYSDRFGTWPGWTNTLSLAGLPRRPKTLTVEVSDFLNNSAQVQRPFIYDRKPVLTVTAPLAETVARPQVHIAAGCTDDDPAGCSLSVSAGGVVVANARDGIDQVVSLPQFEGSATTLHFEAVDSAGQRTFADIPIYVESSIRLSEVASVPASIWDVQPDRILWLQSASDRGILKIRQRASGQDTVAMNESGRWPRYGYLTPEGAIFVEQRGDVLTALVYERRSDVLVELGFPNSSGSLVANGNFAIWSMGETLVLRDLATGANTTVSTSAGNTDNDVAANGDVVYWGGGYNVYRYQGGKTTQLSTDGGLWNTYPLTDGKNVVYRKHDPCCGAQRFGLALHDGSSERMLTPLELRPLGPGSDYQVNNGWVAFTKLGTGGQLQVWTRSPTGAETQITFFGDSSRIEALAPNGEVLFRHGRRFLSRSGVTPLDISSSLGRVFWQDGHWWVIIGRSLFQVQPDNRPVSLDQTGLAANGRFTFRVNGGAGQSVVIQASTDLVHWTDIATKTISSASLDFEDPATLSVDHRFYRALTP